MRVGFPILLTAGAAAARFVGLTTQSFWLDEQISGLIAAQPAAVIWSRPDGEAPLYPLLLHGLASAGLDSDWWLRFPSALGGTLAVPLFLLLARRIEDRRVAAVAALLFAVHPLAIWHAQEARAYALMMLTALVSTWLFLSLMEGRAGVGTIVGYAAATSVGVGLHYYFVFVVAAQAVVAALEFVRRPPSRPRWLAVGGLTAVALGPWAVLLASDFAGQSLVDGQVRFSWLALPYTALSYAGGFSFGPPLRVLHPAARRHVAAWVVVQPYFVPTALAIGLVSTLFVLGALRPLDRRRLLVLLLATLPVLGPWVCSNFGVGFRPRYTLPALPFALLVVAGSLRSRQQWMALFLLPPLAAVEVAAVWQMTAPAYAREDARGAAGFITAAGVEGPIVAVGEGAEPVERYVARPERVRILGPSHAKDRATLEAFAASIAREDEDLFLVESREWTRDPDEIVQKYLDAHRPLRGERAFAGTEVRWYGPLPPPAAP